MFKVLIVEDNAEKLMNILQTLKPIKDLDIESIDHDVDSVSAKKRMLDTTYDLLILDISIPLRKSEKVDPEGGIKLLKEITLRPQYKVPVHIIGLTAHEDVFQKAEKEFTSKVLFLIQYRDGDIEWENQLFSGVDQWVQSKISATYDKISYNYDIAIITAVDVEFQAIKSLVDKWERITYPSDSSIYYETEFKRDDKIFKVIASCAPQMGMNAASVLSMKLINNFRPKYLFMTGIAASIQNNNSHGFGDIFVIDESWDGGAGKITEDANGKKIFLQSAYNLRLDPDITQKVRGFRENIALLRAIKDDWKPGLLPNTELSVHIGSVCSVAGVVENAAVIEELKIKDRKLMGLEMEAYGMYYCANNCAQPKPTPIAFKSVSDFANTEKGDGFQHYAAYTSAKFMYEFIFSELE